MFEMVDAISQIFREPFMNAANQAESIPVLFAFLLGVVGAMAPCQLSGNISAMTLYGTNSLRKGISWKETFMYVLGKITAFSGLGLIVVLLGKEFQRQLPLFFEPMRLILGPLLIIIGLYMLGVFSLKFFMSFWPKKVNKSGKWGAFLLGFSFSLGFCPTMFLLFFVILMPVSLASTAGSFLPAVFALGTALPFLFLIFVIWYLELGGRAVSKSRRIGERVQQAAGIFMIVVGVFDMLTFW
ncbi:sulfite exporter TauE/SafE family protein [Alkalicoccus daliensis]|uniref:Cytochrome C biogenesis protein transmembrane region n=1 Tax=Alkalicoccus daliensis TaxID=745820 RepID=A0A1H0ID80_9BACI|nr:sulfite exporter TauE/SafE family protein [Alkalicoccus daliensis]SDO29315.1 Cytochrome C biogenesis protein transmembrane region [Alkalicoccus daliensis]